MLTSPDINTIKTLVDKTIVSVLTANKLQVITDVVNYQVVSRDTFCHNYFDNLLEAVDFSRKSPTNGILVYINIPVGDYYTTFITVEGPDSRGNYTIDSRGNNMNNWWVYKLNDKYGAPISNFDMDYFIKVAKLKTFLYG